MNETRKRGSIGQETYDAVAALVAGGATAKAACEQVAAETGRSVGTVTNTYYRIARKAKGDGAPSARGRRGPRGRAERKVTTDSLVADLSRAIDALGVHVRSLEAENASLRAKASKYDELSRAFAR